MADEVQKNSSKSERSPCLKRSNVGQSLNEDSYCAMQIHKISPKHHEILKETFNEIYKERIKSGTTVYIKLLCDHPEYKDIWPQLRSVPDSALISSDVIKNLAITYMEALKDIVNSMDNETVLMKHLQRIAEVHIKWRISKKHIQNMLPVFIVMMKQFIKNCNPEIEEAWQLLFEIIVDTLEYLKVHRSRMD